ncbi:MAG TPA: peptidylprolyl isomerase, partial [Ignavibacteriales bacterium]|nr:peptidylprolyl isomerase [Ignavibacteriales bacterium]
GFRTKKGNYGMVDVASGELAKKANELSASGQFSEPFKFEDGYSIVKLIEKKSAGPKTFEEAKSEAMSGYQEQESARLENEYVAKLKQTYKPEVHHEELKEAFKSEK